MTLSAGTRLGPYEILGPLGAGGMGEVYRARDSKLERDIAVKVLPAEWAADAERRRRFEQEARAASSLNHPSIIHIYDVGSSKSVHYIAMELVEGKSLRDLLASGPLPAKRLLDIAIEIAGGIAKAHAAGIAHRDLKPENLIVTGEGHAKILDFGLAKLTRPQGSSRPEISTLELGTEPGVVRGTVGYMSPEQASGKAVDFHSDQFSLGAVFYEMASGRRAFQGKTGLETLAAIVRGEPEPLSRLNPGVPVSLRRIIEERCLAKDPQQRYASTGDLLLDLRSVRDHLSDPTTTTVGLPAPPTKFRQISFGRGTIWSARFDAETVLYGAAWDGRPVEPFLTRLGGPESRSLGFPGADVLAVSSLGEIAISLERRYLAGWQYAGMLARVAVAGGSPRPVLEDVQYADWSPDGKTLAVVREVGGKVRLEYPIGTVLYETVGWISHPRVSPGDDRVAFLEHPLQGDDRGFVAVVDRSGHREALTEEWASEMGLAWSARGDEVWFTAARFGYSRALHAVTLAGVERTVAVIPGALTLHDVSRDGRVLLAREGWRLGIHGVLPGSELERDVSALDASSLRDLSPDGSTLLIREAGEGAPATDYAVYLRRSQTNAPPVLLGEGNPLSLAADGKSILVQIPSERRHLILLPTGAGEVRHLRETGLEYQSWGSFLPDGRRFVCLASEAGRGARLYVQNLEGSQPRALSPEGVSISLGAQTVSLDGAFVAAIGPDKKATLYPVEGGEPQAILGAEIGDVPVRFTTDGRSVFVTRGGELPASVFRIDLATGQRSLWKEIAPRDPAGLTTGVSCVLPTPDGRFYAYNILRLLSDLYVAEGLK